ncbi:FAD-dependent monooxygenase [Polymorphobacter fuscus]|uniref:Ubiquinone biosynthesis protein UbiH n=1 Tax=Sandarakinorhabdus fusca TaxID=1439888 RepID=A0A7C9KI22_9SPHN|nr:FAD-dependent monooxygenase [Polymorphobacter fuscus]KAB7647671.1 ubiquinone biosynthesis protein UbiH [Polymorphobacter fuscus]MQT16961.1 ubiquinone biosynthesis protein UbiH [Polymorphobacter fuscus]NJC09049.1 2-octaprenyl-6-methoxyphenol hydroxylase [Polymorphobacter fuscus]
MNADVIIIGGGLIGSTLALALARHEVTSIVVDTQDLDATTLPAFDGRASAVASASARMLRALGLGTVLDTDGCAIRAIRVTDGTAPQFLHFDAGAADASGQATDPLGIMLENRLLRIALLDAVRAAPEVTLVAPATVASLVRDDHAATLTLDDGRVFTAPLAIAADGRKSKTRDAAGIRLAAWHYPNAALVSMVAHSQPHGEVACELFYPSGPMALLPMTDHSDGRPRSAIVWTVDAANAAGARKLGPRALAAEIAARVDGTLGDIDVIAPQAVWPLGYHHAASYTAQRLVLVGDAAHGIHPIAGQGLNMGFRDVAALAQVLVEAARTGQDLGAPGVLSRYTAWRRLDNMMVGAVTDGLNRLFAVPGRLPAAVRRLGLAGVERVPALKARFMAEARGETGTLPALLTGELI